ncbi:PFL_4695 family integrating conjugative element protein [Photobacterium damselae]|uniref:PFL_4695 family integrating conjugative element protein n=1 Tax=Photobacterium damselae TaxID=38293 RepID=UPI0040696F7B
MTLNNPLTYSLGALLVFLTTSANGGTELQQLKPGTIPTVEITTVLGADGYQQAQIAAKSVTMADLAKEVEKHQLTEKQTKDALYESIFPLHTPSMSVSQNIPYRTFTKEYPFVPILAIVGSDQYSLQWLRNNRDRIKQSRAIVILVEADSDTQFRNVLKAADGLEVIPVPANDISKEYGIKNYPVLVTKLGYGQ